MRRGRHFAAHQGQHWSRLLCFKRPDFKNRQKLHQFNTLEICFAPSSTFIFLEHFQQSGLLCDISALFNSNFTHQKCEVSCLWGICSRHDNQTTHLAAQLRQHRTTSPTSRQAQWKTNFNFSCTTQKKVTGVAHFGGEGCW